MKRELAAIMRANRVSSSLSLQLCPSRLLSTAIGSVRQTRSKDTARTL